MVKFLLVFIILTISEVYLMKIVAEKIGILPLIGIVLSTGFIGLAVAKKQGKAHLLAIQQELTQGKMPGNPIVEGLLILIAAVTLITPGFITDFLGFLLLIPFVRRLLAPKIAKLFKPKIANNGATFFHFSSSSNSFSDGFENLKNRGQEGDVFDMPEDPKKDNNKNLPG